MAALSDSAGAQSLLTEFSLFLWDVPSVGQELNNLHPQHSQAKICSKGNGKALRSKALVGQSP
jgi:hypothetical protein